MTAKRVRQPPASRPISMATWSSMPGSCAWLGTPANTSSPASHLCSDRSSCRTTLSAPDSSNTEAARASHRRSPVSRAAAQHSNTPWSKRAQGNLRRLALVLAPAGGDGERVVLAAHRRPRRVDGAAVVLEQGAGRPRAGLARLADRIAPAADLREIGLVAIPPKLARRQEDLGRRRHHHVVAAVGAPRRAGERLLALRRGQLAHGQVEHALDHRRCLRRAPRRLRVAQLLAHGERQRHRRLRPVRHRQAVAIEIARKLQQLALELAPLLPGETFAHEPVACPSTVLTARCQPAYLRSRSGAASCGLNPRCELPEPGEARRIRPHAGLVAREPGGAQRRRLLHDGPLDRRVQDVGQELHGPVARHHAAVDAQHGLRRARPVAVHGVEQIARLVADGLQRRARDLVGAGGARQAEQRAARVGLPVGRAEPDEGRHQVDVLRRVGLGGERAALRRPRR